MSRTGAPLPLAWSGLVVWSHQHVSSAEVARLRPGDGRRGGPMLKATTRGIEVMVEAFHLPE
jgi:hypothetical protein